MNRGVTIVVAERLAVDTNATLNPRDVHVVRPTHLDELTPPAVNSPPRPRSPRR